MSEDRKPDMSRGQQTKIIVSVIIVIAVVFGLYGYNYLRTHDSNDPDAVCNGIFQPDVTKCKADRAVRRLRGY